MATRAQLFEIARQRRQAQQPESDQETPDPIVPQQMIPGVENIEPGRTGLQKTLGALDYLGNISRAGIVGAVNPNVDFLTAITQAAKNKKRYSAEAVKSTFGVPDFGKNNQSFDIGDIPDFVVNTGIDIATDPLTWLTAGAGSIARKVVGEGAAPALKAIQATQGGEEALNAVKAATPITGKVGEELVSSYGEDLVRKAAKAQTLQRGIGAGIGAVAGAGTQDPNASVADRLEGAAFGAAAVAAGQRYVPEIAKYLKGGIDPVTGERVAGKLDNLADWYAKKYKGIGVPLPPEAARQTAEMKAMETLNGKYKQNLSIAEIEKKYPQEFGDLRSEYEQYFSNPPKYSEAVHLAKRAQDKFQNIVARATSGMGNVLGGMDDLEKVTAQDFFKVLKNETVQYRNKLEKKYIEAFGPGLNQTQLDEITKAANEHITQKLPELIKGQSQKTIEAVDKLVTHNAELVQQFNKITGRDIVGLKYHTEGVQGLAQDYANDLENFVKLKDSIVHRATVGRRFARGGEDQLSNEEAYRIYAERFARSTLNKQEKVAIRFMHAMRDPAQIGASGSEAWNKFLNGYDDINNFFKTNALLASTTWLKNNYWDNLAKAYIESGVIPAAKTAAFGADKALLGDLKTLITKGPIRGFKHAETLDAYERGVLTGDNFTAFDKLDPRVAKYVFSPEKASELTSKKEGRNLLQRGIDNWTDFLQGKTGVIGQAMEGSARMTTYLHTIDALKKTELPGALAESFTKAGKKDVQKLVDSKLKDIAADVTKRTFFDYKDIHEIERAVMARMFPFYRYYSKNLPYWVDALTNYNKVGRALVPFKARQNIGVEPSPYEVSGMNSYQKNAGPRRYQDKTITAPSFSAFDALSALTPTGLGEQTVEKLGPIPKAAYEIPTNSDLFLGTKLYPSSMPHGQKPMFGRGYNYLALQKVIDALTGAQGSLGMKLNKKGNPQATSDTLTFFDKLLSTVMPTPALDQAGNVIGKTFGPRDLPLSRAALELTTPIKVTDFNPDVAKMNREKNLGKSVKKSK